MTLGSRLARRPLVVLGGILIVAAAVRWLGLEFGLPAVYNPDEVAIMSRALAFAKGDLNPHNFLYPTFYFYALFVWIGGYFTVAWASGAVASLQAFQTQFFTDPSAIYLAGRTFSAVCGVLTVALVYRFAARLFDRAAGLAAAGFLAVAPFAVRDAHYVKHDVPATLAVVAACLAMGRLEDATGGDRRRGWTRVVLAGSACGVAFSTHYYTVFLALPLAIAVLSAQGAAGRRVRSLAAAAAASAVVFVALSPFLPLEWRTALADISANRQIVVDRAAQSGGWMGGVTAYGRMLWRDAIGWPVVLLALGGIVALWRESARRALWFLAFPVAYAAFIANTVPATRYLNPLLPFVAWLAGLAVSRLGARRGAAGAVTGVALCLLAAVPGAVASWQTGWFFRQPDTRTLAREWIESHVPAGASVAIQPYSVPLTQSRDSLVEALRHTLGDERRASTKFSLRLALDPYPAPAYRTIYLGSGGLDADKIYVDYAGAAGPAAIEALRALQVTFVVLKRYNAVAPEMVPFQDALAADATRLVSFSPLRPGASRATPPEPYLHNLDARIVPGLERPGPYIDVWQLHERH